MVVDGQTAGVKGEQEVMEQDLQDNYSVSTTRFVLVMVAFGYFLSGLFTSTLLTC